MKRTLRSVLIGLFVLCSAIGAASAATVVDLCMTPGGGTVANGTMLSDQWRPIGILFDANPGSVDPVKQDFGGSTCHLFFSPDIMNVDAVFTFVEPGTTTPSDAQTFTLDGFYDPGESAELVGLDGSGSVVATAMITPGDVGSSSKTLRMTITGPFRTVEWRTHGNPGIAGSFIEFELPPVTVPTLPPLAFALLLLAILWMGLHVLRRRRAIVSGSV